jgi:uncharacterized protein DUF6263
VIGTRFAVRLLAAATCLLPALAACEGQGEVEGVRLRFEYSEGDTLRYAYESNGTVTIPDTTDATGTIERSYQRTMRVEEVAEDVTARGHYLLAVTYQLPADSATGEAPAPVTIHLEMTPQGKIENVTGVETAKPLFGDIDFQSYFEQAQPVFPDRRLRVGDSWTQEVRVVAANSEPVTTSSTYVLRALNEEDGEPVATIAFDGEIFLPIGHSTSAAGPAKSSPQLAEERIRVQGTIYFAHERGQVRRVETSARATVTKLTVEEGETTRQDLHIQERSRMQLIPE